MSGAPLLNRTHSTSSPASGDAQYWGEVGQEYTVHRLWRTHSDAVNIDWLSREMPRGRVGRLLKTDLFDEAVNDGLVAWLSTRAETVVGIDLARTTVQAALTRHHGLRALAADVRCLPFADGDFDTVVSNSTLDHFRTSAELADSIKELSRVLRPGGELYLTLDNPLNPLVALRNALPFRLLNRFGLLPYFVGATCGPQPLRAELERAGLHVLQEGTLLHCPRVLVVKIAQILERWATPATQRRFLRHLMGHERLRIWPTRFFTGNFITARAMKLVAPLAKETAGK
jgi:SAM-dependent methyltransferase